MDLFYATDIQPPYLYLHHEEAIHCLKSLRKTINEPIYATDGMGTAYECIITAIDKRRNVVQAYIQKQSKHVLPFQVGLCVAPTKSIDRMEWLLEKAVELGISQVQWVITSHSERKTISVERMRRIAVAAMKQSLRYFLPTIYEIIPFQEWIDKNPHLSGVIGYCGNEIPKQFLYSVQKPKDADIFWICIGPEGDFTQNEVKKAIEKGLVAISLGNHRLRTETAALTVLSYYYILNLQN